MTKACIKMPHPHSVYCLSRKHFQINRVRDFEVIMDGEKLDQLRFECGKIVRKGTEKNIATYIKYP